MKNLYRMMILAAAACASCAAPRMKPIETGLVSQRPYGYPIDVYEAKLLESNRKVAIIESAGYPSDDEETRLKQVEQLKQRAREVGADAVEDVRILTKKIKGMSLDEKTPAASFKQGNYNLYFMRGMAVVLDTSLPGAVTAEGGFTTEPQGYVTPEIKKYEATAEAKANAAKLEAEAQKKIEAEKAPAKPKKKIF